MGGQSDAQKCTEVGGVCIFSAFRQGTDVGGLLHAATKPRFKKTRDLVTL